MVRGRAPVRRCPGQINILEIPAFMDLCQSLDLTAWGKMKNATNLLGGGSIFRGENAGKCAETELDGVLSRSPLLKGFQPS